MVDKKDAIVIIAPNKLDMLKEKKNKRYRWDVILDLINKNGYQRFLEIGLGHGATATRLLARIKDVDFEYTGIDPFLMYPEYTGDNNSKQKIINRNVKAVHQNVLKDKRARLIQNYSKEASKIFKFNEFDIIFIDGNHAYEYVKEDINIWYNRVRSGGVLCGHDYVETGKHVGVKKAVDEFAKKHKAEVKIDGDNVWYFYKKRSRKKSKGC